jgi:hypothetical protein
MKGPDRPQMRQTISPRLVGHAGEVALTATPVGASDRPDSGKVEISTSGGEE